MWSNAQQHVLGDNPWGSNASSATQQQVTTTNSEIESWATFPTDNFADFDSHFESFDMPQVAESGNELETNNDKGDQFFDANLEDSHDEIIT